MSSDLERGRGSTPTRVWRVRYDSELNPEQLRVVMHPGGPMLALAGAGSGKTRTLVYRVCRLIEEGVPPGRILLLTFTNKAAREMLDRVQQLVEHGAGRVMGGTFHSAGHRILRRYAERLGYSPRFSIIDREDSTDLMGNALADVSPKLEKRRTPRPKLLVNLYSFVINTGHDLERVLLEQAPQHVEQAPFVAEVFKRYLERKRDADLMDFDDLLLNWLLLLQRHSDARQELQERFSHILVDEYQDTNRLQADIVASMLSADRNVMVVGDDAQSIYAFRGADFDNIIGFPERYPGCAVFNLEANYRSVPPVLALANASIVNNQRQFPKRLTPVRSGGELPMEVAAPTPEAQARYVADEILASREEGTELEGMVVLYRNHAHSLDIQVELTRRNIPFRVRSGLRFFEQRHIKDALAHLRFVDNPRDEVAFARMVKLRRGFGPRLAARLWHHISLGDTLSRFLSLGTGELELPRPAASSLHQLQELVDTLTSPRLLGQPGEALREVVAGFYGQWARDNLQNAGSRLEDLEQLALFADGYSDLNSFLAEITLLNEVSGEEQVGGPTDEVLTLSTIHQAKGLEWHTVFVIWLAEGRFPSSRAEDEEEERRLFYVAATRACDRLFLVYPSMARDRYRIDVVLNRSRFLLELPDALTAKLEVREEPESIPALPLPEARYELPAFLDPADGDDEVN